MAICRSLGPAEIGSLSPVIIGTVLMRYLPEGVASGHIVETDAYVVGGTAPSHPAIQTDGGFLGGSYRFKNYRQKHRQKILLT
jgi:hypothetical protein